MNDRVTVSRRALVRGAVAGAATATVATGVVSPLRTARAHTFPATVQDVQTSLYEADNTTYGTASIGGSYAHCQLVFTAPETGRVLIHWSGAPRNLSPNNSPVAYLSFQVRQGGTPGSGTVVLDTSDTRSVRTNLAGSQTVRAGASYLLGSLTPSATYNVRMLHRVTSSSAEFFHRTLIVAAAS